MNREEYKLLIDIPRSKALHSDFTLRRCNMQTSVLRWSITQKGSSRTQFIIYHQDDEKNNNYYYLYILKKEILCALYLRFRMWIKFRSWPTWWQNFYRRSFFILCTAHTKWIACRVQCWCTTNKWMMTVVDGDSRMVCNWWLCQLYVFYVIKILAEQSTHVHIHSPHILTHTHARANTRGWVKMNKLRKQSTEQGYYFGEFYFRWETEYRRNFLFFLIANSKLFNFDLIRIWLEWPRFKLKYMELLFFHVDSAPNGTPISKPWNCTYFSCYYPHSGYSVIFLFPTNSHSS